MKHALAVLLTGALLLAGTPAGAAGYGGKHGHGYGGHSYIGYGYGFRPSYGYRHGYGHRRGHRGSSLSFHYSGHGGDVLAGLAVGAVIGALVARPHYQPRRHYRPSPAHTRVQPRNCQPTTGTGHYRGRPAVFGGTYCRTADGHGYIVAGSEHFLGYR